MIDYEQGGIALNDSSLGLMVQKWRATYDTNCSAVKVSPYPYTTDTAIFTAAGITELSLAFDQNMRPAVAYVSADIAKLYWYDSFLNSVTTTTFASDVRCPFLSMDDKRSVASQTNSNDILFFYIRGNNVYYRQQRDRFVTERQIASFVSSGTVRIAQAGMTSKLRVKLRLSSTEAISVTPTP